MICTRPSQVVYTAASSTVFYRSLLLKGGSFRETLTQKTFWGQPLQNPAALPFCFHLSTNSLRQVRRFQTLDKNLVTGSFLLLDQPFESIQMVLNFFNFTSQFGGIILVGFFNLFRSMDEDSKLFNSSCQVTTCSGQL